MDLNARTIIAVSVTLAVLTFAIGYIIYEEAYKGSGFIEITPVSETLQDARHTAAAPVNNTQGITFSLSAPANASVWVTTTPGGRLPLAETSPGSYTGVYPLSTVTESGNVTVVFSLDYKGTIINTTAPPIIVDLTPPEILAARTVSTAYEKDDELTLMVESEEGSAVQAELQTLHGLKPMKEISPGMYSMGYLVRRGDDRDSLVARVVAEDALGNIAEKTFTLFTTITTDGPQLLSLDISPKEVLGLGETAEFTIRGEENATGYMDLGIANDIPLQEDAPGVYKAWFTLGESGIAGETSVIVRLTTDVTSSKGMGYFAYDSKPPLIKTFSADTDGAIKAGQPVTITLLAEPNGTAHYRLEGVTAYTEMAAAGGGYYTSIFTPTTQNAADVPIIGAFVDEAGNAAEQVFADERLTIDTIAPEIAEVVFDAPATINASTRFRAALRAEDGGKASLSLLDDVFSLPAAEDGWYELEFSLGEGNYTTQAIPIFMFEDAARNTAPAVQGPIVTIDNDPPEIVMMDYKTTGLLTVGSSLNATMEAEAGGKAWFMLRDIDTNYSIGPVYMYEEEAGIYRGRYQVRETDIIGKAVIIGYFEDSAGNPAEPYLVQPKAATSPFQFNFLLGIAIVAFLIPTFFFYYNKYVEKAGYEESFPDFLTELHSVMGSQLPLPQALKIISRSDFGRLSALVRRMNNRITIGVPFHEAFTSLGRETGSKSITSAVSVLMSGYKAGGGRLTKMFEATAANFRRLRLMKQERQSELQIHVLTGYIIFIVFLVILVMLNNTLFSAEIDLGMGVFGLKNETIDLTVEQMISKLQEVGTSPAGANGFADLLFYLFFIQAFFSGISIGELTEGSFMAGLKHSVVMMVIALIATAFLI